VRSLVAGGTKVIAWDDNSTARDLGGQEGAEIMPWREWPWESIAALVLSPGVPLTHPAPHGVVVHANPSQSAGDRRRRTLRSRNPPRCATRPARRR
jgi:UDP-N-acetylmuramoylalanine-D-glutamate ligase